MERNKSEKVAAASLCCDILVFIFEFLDTRSKGRAAQVCSSWREAANCKSIWKDVKVKMKSENLNIESENSIISRNIKRFDVYIFNPRLNEFLRRVPDLEYLRFIGCCLKQYPKEFFHTVLIPDPLDGRTYGNYLTPSQRRDLFAIAFDKYHSQNYIPHSCQPSKDHVLKTFATGLKNLKVLHLNGCKFRCGRFEFDIFSTVEATSENQLTSLQKLYIKDLIPVEKCTMDFISQKCINLVSLSFKRCNMSEGGLLDFRKLEKLEFLSLKSVCDLTDITMSHISHISNLKSLNLDYCYLLTDNSLMFISRLTNLVRLKMKSLRVTDVAFSQLNKLTGLRELGLCASTISDTGLSYLAGGDLKLTNLDISYCENVRDQGLSNICGSKFVLQSLNISGCDFIDSGVSLIIDAFPHLQVLATFECDGLTETIRKLIDEKFPQSKKIDLDDIEENPDAKTLNTEEEDSLLKSFLKQIGG